MTTRATLSALRKGLLPLLMLTSPLTWAQTGPSTVSRHDDTVIESVPARDRMSANERRLRQQLAIQADHAPAAVELAEILLSRSRAEGDPRPAGQALALLSVWPDAKTAPPDVLMMRANLQQHLHDFSAARSNLEQLLVREPRHAQGWLTLATLHRLQGRYKLSDQACQAVQRAGELFYAQACRAENLGLQGQVTKARDQLQTLIEDKTRTTQQRSWLLTTLAELEARNRRPHAAELAYRAASQYAPADGYVAVSYADFLLQLNRPADALALLKYQVRSDAVLLRLAYAGQLLKTPQAGQDVSELTRRMALDKLTPQERLGHAREHALFALWIQKDPVRALELARLNLTLQREPLDLLLLAQAARASQNPQALIEVRQLKKEMGLVDERLDQML